MASADQRNIVREWTPTESVRSSGTLAHAGCQIARTLQVRWWTLSEVYSLQVTCPEFQEKILFVLEVCSHEVVRQSGRVDPSDWVWSPIGLIDGMSWHRCLRPTYPLSR